MLVVKRKTGKLSIILLWFSVLITLTGCFGNPPPEVRFKYSEDEGNGYDIYGGYDVREMAEQVDGYWDYYRENEKQKKRRLLQIDSWSGEWIKAGKYTVGKDIQEGLYLGKNIDDGYTLDVTVNRKDENKEDRWLSSLSYFLLNEGDIVSIDDGTFMTPIDKFDFSLPSRDGIYYEGSYKVGEEIPEGEYFVLSMGILEGSSAISNERDELIGAISRFGYVTIRDELAVNLEGCILISLDQEPKISPIRYQGEDGEKGKLVFATGMYKVGKDLPVGTYKMKNEIYTSISDLSYEGYHGNKTDYYAGYWNFCGLTVKNKKQTKQLGWSEVELDSYIGSKKRYIKITDPEGKISYKEFDGLPEVTFTEKDIGSNVKVTRCVLIPETN
ncbi:hypothetical protein [Clostridium sp. Marseille-P2415]|uniref:hypothetical protein n=1 Tax=Clostridium sp. Marseille-P2415 TaxID=1805471 RepID=UPI0009888353|nr:hypothetical protein [Clostridium sp. Marseille-P2415]